MRLPVRESRNALTGNPPPTTYFAGMAGGLSDGTLPHHRKESIVGITDDLQALGGPVAGEAVGAAHASSP